MTDSQVLASIRRWLMLIALLLTIQVFFTAGTANGVYLSNVVTLAAMLLSLFILAAFGSELVTEKGSG